MAVQATRMSIALCVVVQCYGTRGYRRRPEEMPTELAVPLSVKPSVRCLQTPNDPLKVSLCLHASEGRNVDMSLKTQVYTDVYGASHHFTTIIVLPDAT
jgi:hypothetical protein